MSTLAEIEAAVDALPGAQQAALLHRLEARLHRAAPQPARLVEEDGVSVLVAPDGAPAMTPALVKAVLAEVP